VCLKLVCSGARTGKVNLSVVNMLYYIVIVLLLLTIEDLMT